LIAAQEERLRSLQVRRALNSDFQIPGAGVPDLTDIACKPFLYALICRARTLWPLQ
jgi:hypothetical protein